MSAPSDPLLGTHSCSSAQAYADPELVHGVNPAWRQVDRIVAERTSQIDGREVGGVRRR